LNLMKITAGWDAKLAGKGEFSIDDIEAAWRSCHCITKSGRMLPIIWAAVPRASYGCSTTVRMIRTRRFDELRIAAFHRLVIAHAERTRKSGRIYPACAPCNCIREWPAERLIGFLRLLFQNLTFWNSLMYKIRRYYG
jgi:hypothetical protein